MESPQSLVDHNFSAGDSFCKAILCLLASKKPKNFKDNREVILDNSWLKQANSRNYHHFFPKAYLKKNKLDNSNSLVNITLISDRQNKYDIGAKAPLQYISTFQKDNSEINETLQSHFIELEGFGIENDNYEEFLQARAKRVYDELMSRINFE